MGDVFEYYYEPSRKEILLKKTRIALIGLLALAGTTFAFSEGVPKYREIMDRYESEHEKPIQSLSDEDMVKKFVKESKYRDPNTGSIRLVYKLSGAMAVQSHLYEKDGLQPASISNFVLVKLHNNKTYIYGENALIEPKIFRLDQAVVCALSDTGVRLEEVELGHDIQGGIALKDTGMFLPNDRDWQEKCVAYIPNESIAVSAEI